LHIQCATKCIPSKISTTIIIDFLKKNTHTHPHTLTNKSNKIQEMMTMAINSDDTHENENIELTHWLYSMIVYYVLQITCIITVRIK